MASYSTNEFRSGLKVLLDGDPCIILDNELVKPGKGQAFSRVKLRNLMSNRVWERTFKSGESLEAADVVDQDMEYLYTDGEFWHFMLTDGSFEQYPADAKAVGDTLKWLKEQDVYTVTLYNGAPLTITPPNFVELEVVETDPGMKGDTAQGGSKPATLSTGAVVSVPLFITIGEVLKVDTRSGEYMNRVKAADASMINQPDWQPSASRSALKGRAQQSSFVRGFFVQRDVLEVETPVLGRCGVTEPNLDGVSAQINAQGAEDGWLQTSPEYHMKRLLAAGSGSIYQISKVFRSGERGRRHNPEFSMLEWYRTGLDDVALMAEVSDLVCGWLKCPRPQITSYRQAMIDWAGIDPFVISESELHQRCRQWLEPEQLKDLSRDGCLDLLMSFAVEPNLGTETPVFINQYPASQASLARISRVDGFDVAHRFELYIDGLELCNGYWELTCADEQRNRFEADNRLRKAAGKPEMKVDEAFLAALEQGLPDCAGVALGLDRLLMLKIGTRDIADVLAFPLERA